jgi:hypothetical protein
MTVKRDLKRRVRQRQARTGESYVTARRHVLAARPAPDAEEPDTDAATATDMDAAADDDMDTAADADGVAGGDLGEDGTPEPGARVVFEFGDRVRVIDGPFAGSSAMVEEVRPDEQKLKISLSIVGPSVELDFAQVEHARRATTGAPVAAVPVVELVDVSEQARRVGLLCRVTMFPALAQRIEPATVLKRLRDLLVETAGDPQTLLLASVALTGNVPRQPPRRPQLNIDQLRRFFVRARAGLGGTSEDGSALAFHVAADGGIVPILCSLSWSPAWRDASLTLSAIDDLTAEPWNLVQSLRGAPQPSSFGQRLLIAPRRPEDEFEQALVGGLRPRSFGRTLCIIHDGRSYPITRDEFLIGCDRKAVHLAIEDGNVSRLHAAVIRRDGAYYIKDLGSTHGILYKGMRIDNKRIDDGDAFEIGGHQLRFTFEA